MKNILKKFVAGASILSLAAAVTPLAAAATSDTVAVSVTITEAVSLAVTNGDTLAFTPAIGTPDTKTSQLTVSSNSDDGFKITAALSGGTTANALDGDGFDNTPGNADDNKFYALHTDDLAGYQTADSYFKISATENSGSILDNANGGSEASDANLTGTVNLYTVDTTSGNRFTGTDEVIDVSYAMSIGEEMPADEYAGTITYTIVASAS